MSRVITFSIFYPKYHPRKGKYTFFIEKIFAGFTIPNDSGFKPKHTTIRKGKRWKVGDLFSPRVWDTNINQKSGRSGPYHSNQIVVMEDLLIKKVWDFEITKRGDFVLNDDIIPIGKVMEIAINDGFDTLDDFYRWFNLKLGESFSGQIICWNANINY